MVLPGRFAGYTGGPKAILPGCASGATIQNNHAMMVRPEAEVDGYGADRVVAEALARVPYRKS